MRRFITRWAYRILYPPKMINGWKVYRWPFWQKRGKPLRCEVSGDVVTKILWEGD